MKGWARRKKNRLRWEEDEPTQPGTHRPEQCVVQPWSRGLIHLELGLRDK